MEEKITNIKERILQISDFYKVGKEYFFTELGISYGNFKGKSKNTDVGNVVIPNNTIELLRSYFKYIEADKYDKDTFVFSTKLLPGTIEKTTRYPGGIWAEIRKKLNFPKEYKLYSLRDTSITELLLSNIPTISVQKHARHSSLEMTQIYADHITPKMLEDIKTNTTNLF